MSKPIFVLGAGGHASAIVDILRVLNSNIAAIIAGSVIERAEVFEGINIFQRDEMIFSYAPDEVLLVNAIGSLPDNQRRFKVHQDFKRRGYKFMRVVSPAAIVSPYAVLEEGVQIMQGAIINANSRIGEASIVNSGAIVEHDCVIGKFNHLAPGVTLSGQVSTGEAVHIGTGANVIQGITIGDNSLVGAGATVVANMRSNKRLYVAKPFLAEGNT